MRKSSKLHTKLRLSTFLIFHIVILHLFNEKNSALTRIGSFLPTKDLIHNSSRHNNRKKGTIFLLFLLKAFRRKTNSTVSQSPNNSTFLFFSSPLSPHQLLYIYIAIPKRIKFFTALEIFLPLYSEF